MTKAEKVVRDILHDRCSGFKIDNLDHNELSTGHKFNLTFDIPVEYMAHVDLKMVKAIVDVFNVENVFMRTFNRGFRVDVKWLPPEFKVDVSTAEGVRATQDTSVGPVRCTTCNEPPFKTLALALEHVELVHRGDVELDRTFDAKTAT